MMVIAVGAGDRIAAALPELGALLPRPVRDVGAVQVCKRDGVLIAPPHALPGADEDGRPLWPKLTVFTSEAQQHNGRPVHRAIVRRAAPNRRGRRDDLARPVGIPRRPPTARRPAAPVRPAASPPSPP